MLWVITYNIKFPREVLNVKVAMSILGENNLQDLAK